MGTTIDEAIKRYKNNAEYERTHGSLQGCLEFRQLAEWLEQLQKIQGIMDELNGNFYGSYLKDRQTLEKIYEVLEDGKAD